MKVLGRTNNNKSVLPKDEITELLPTKTSQLTNDSNFITTIPSEYITEDELTTELNNKQDKLVSSTNIKTINNTSILGNGNITTPNTTYSEITDAEINAGTASTARAISGRRAKKIIDNAKEGKQDELVSGTNIKTVNGNSILGSGNISTPNTTYSEITEAEINAGSSTTTRAISGRRSQIIVNKARAGLVEGNANANNIVSNIFIGTQAEYDALPNKTGILAIIEE